MSLLPYSHSKVALFYQCPYKFKLNYIDKIKKFNQNVALFKGSFAHLILENKFDYNVEFKTNEIFKENDKETVKSYIKNFENCELGQKYKNIMLNDKIKKKFEEYFLICKNKQNEFFACDKKENAIFLGYIDFMYFEEKENSGIPEIELNIIDWKTGKFKELKNQGPEQVELYAIWGFLKYPEIQKIKCKFVYIEHCKETFIEFKRKEINNLITKHLKRIKKIQISKKLNEFDKKPSPLCNWCDYYGDECDGKVEFTIPNIKF